MCFSAPLPPVSMLSHLVGSDRPLNQHWHWGGGGCAYWMGEPIFLARIVWVWRFWSSIYTMISRDVVFTPISIKRRELRQAVLNTLHIFSNTSKHISCMSAHVVTLANMVKNMFKYDIFFNISGDLHKLVSLKGYFMQLLRLYVLCTCLYWSLHPLLYSYFAENNYVYHDRQW